MPTLPKLFDRHLEGALESALADTPVVLVVGPRQSGKTTLCESIFRARDARRVNLDDAAVLGAAASDPQGFIAAQDGPLFIDEIQKAPQLLPAIKLAVDRDRKAGRFLLTGSAQVLALPKVSESLAGRVEILTLLPFSQGELARRPERFLDAIFSPNAFALTGSGDSRAALLGRALRGGFHDALGRRDPARRAAWFRSYATTILQRDIRDIAHVDGLTELPRLLAILAARAATVLNISDLSRTAAVPLSTLTRYLSLFESTFLFRRIPAWTGSRARRYIRAPRVIFTDTGLMAHLAGLSTERLESDPPLVGPLLENFVATELLKQLTWSRAAIEIFHFRTYAGREVDLVLERDDGRVVGVEVKASATLSRRDAQGLEELRDVAGARFHRGVILYTGREVLPLTPEVWAMPIDALWRLEPTKRGRALPSARSC